MNKFEKLSIIDCSDKIESKNGFTYLSWSWAWAKVKSLYPDANYSIREWDNKPYLYDELLGYMVQTSVTIENETLTMHLPVMDNRNKAMKETATMLDINKAIMRCLTKTIAMHGLGLYIYAGDDLPSLADDVNMIEEIEKVANNEQLNKLWKRLTETQKVEFKDNFSKRKNELNG